MQASVGEEGGGVACDGLGDRFDDEAGEGPFQSRAVDPRVDDFHQGGRGGDHLLVVGAGQGESGGDSRVAEDGLG
jgi:hypothetical protein